MRKTRSRLGAIRGWQMAMVAGLFVLAAGCSDDSTTQPPEEFAPPTGLTFVNGDGYVDLSWTPSTGAGLDDFSGYNVYRHTSSMAGMTATQVAGYKLNSSVISVGHEYSDNGADNGVKYYYAVRAVRGGNILSEPSNEINTAARREGDVVIISEFAYSGHPSGLNCRRSLAFSMSSSNPDNRDSIDIYLGTTGNSDESDQALALKSPHRVQNGAPAWANREAELLLLGDLSSWDLGQPPDNAIWSSEITLGSTSQEVVGKVIAIRTPANASNKYHYAKLKIFAMPGTTAGQRQIEVQVAYQDLENYPRFSQGR